jgi:hypothetical protein
MILCIQEVDATDAIHLAITLVQMVVLKIYQDGWNYLVTEVPIAPINHESIRHREVNGMGIVSDLNIFSTYSRYNEPPTYLSN